MRDKSSSPLLFPTKENETVQEDVEVEVALQEDPNPTPSTTFKIDLTDEYKSFKKETQQIAKPKSDVTLKLVDQEMKLFEAKGRISEHPTLEKLYRALLTIKPTSCEPERAFSSMGYFVTKIRNRLNDDTVDALIFQRQYYRNIQIRKDKKKMSESLDK